MNSCFYPQRTVPPLYDTAGQQWSIKNRAVHHERFINKLELNISRGRVVSTVFFILAVQFSHLIINVHDIYRSKQRRCVPVQPSCSKGWQCILGLLTVSLGFFTSSTLTNAASVGQSREFDPLHPRPKRRYRLLICASTEKRRGEKWD